MQDRYGRNGTDRLNRFLLIVALILFVLSWITPSRSSLLPVVLIAVTYFRLFSRNIARRYQENVMYCQLADRVKAALGIRANGAQGSLNARVQQWKARMQQAKTHHIYRCPSCGQKIRVPRGKGRIEIRCPKCNAAFVKRS